MRCSLQENPKLEPRAFSAFAVAFLVAAVSTVQPHNIMVRKLENTNSSNNSSDSDSDSNSNSSGADIVYELTGVDVDAPFERGMFAYDRLMASHACADLFGTNALFCCPQMGDALHPAVLHLLTDSQTAAEECVARWLQELGRQSACFEALVARGDGLSQTHLEQLHMPLQLPSGASASMYERLLLLRAVLSGENGQVVTHDDLFEALYPRA